MYDVEAIPCSRLDFPSTILVLYRTAFLHTSSTIDPVLIMLRYPGVATLIFGGNSFGSHVILIAR